MLGSAFLKIFLEDGRFDVVGTIRAESGKHFFPKKMLSSLLSNIDVLDIDALTAVIDKARPDVVINCIGLIKQHAQVNDPLMALPINAIFPHRLAKLCSLSGARLVHISTDCVYSGRDGMYVEDIPSDAEDLYGKSKYIGELHDFPHAITLRTSIIGHELYSTHSLVDWFLAQKGSVKGYQKAIFSGLPTVELAKVVIQHVLPKNTLTGLYHVSSEPIDKYTLLQLISGIYKKEIEIVPDNQVVIDRSLDSSRFQKETGYRPTPWNNLVEIMHQSHIN